MVSPSVSADDAVGRILAKPAAPWQPPQSQQMLRYRLRVGTAPEAFTVAARLFGADTPRLLQEVLRAGALAIHHTARATRIELAGDAAGGPGAVLVRHTGYGMLLVDPAARGFLQCDEQQLVRFVAEQTSEAEVVSEERGEWQQRPVRILTLAAPAGEVRLRSRIALLDAPELAPYAEEAARFLLGCGPGEPANCGAVISGGGLPVRGESFFDDGKGERPGATFELEEIALVDYDPALFAIPADYRDFRDHPATPGEGGGSGPAGTRDIRRRAAAAPAAAATATRDDGLAEAVAEPSACRCLTGTYDSRVAFSVEQEFLFDVRTIANLINKRLTGFAARDGKLKVPWLAQFKQFADSRPMGDGIYCLLRDELNVGKPGLLDRLAEMNSRRDLGQKLFADLPIDWTGVPAATVDAVKNVYADTTIKPYDRYDRLGAEQRNFRELYLAQNLAQFTVDYPHTTGWEAVFYDLLRIKIDDLQFDVDINDPADPLPARRILLDSLAVAANGEIKFHALLKGAHGKTFLGRLPGALYIAIKLFGPLICVFVPPACAVIPLITTIGQFFFFDFAHVEVDVRDVVIDGTIGWTPDTARNDGSIVPKTTLEMTMTRDVRYVSYVPSSISWILAFVISMIGTHLDQVVDLLEGEAAKRLDGLLADTLKLRFPPDFWRVPASGLSAQAQSAADQYLCLSAKYDPASVGIVAPFITLVDPDLVAGLVARRDGFVEWVRKQATPAAKTRHYGGLAISQNFLNYYIHSLWRHGRYDYELTDAERNDFLGRLRKICTACGGRGRLWRVRICPAVSPRILVAAHGAATGGAYLMTFFDDLRLCLNFGLVDEDLCTLELKFAARTVSEIGFGGVDAGAGRLDITKITDNFMDIYHDVDALVVQPQEILDLGADNVPYCLQGLKVADLPMLTDGLRAVLQSDLRRRDRKLIPRAMGDAPTIQRYPLFSDHELVMKLDAYRGNLYAHFGMTGTALSLLFGDGVLLDAADCKTVQMNL